MNETSEKRKGFFEFLFGKQEGYLAISLRETKTGAWRDFYYPYPEDLDKALHLINRSVTTHDVYYCATLLTAPKIVKENIQQSLVAWADIDSAPPDCLKIQPTILIESSEGRTQGLWMFEETIHAGDVEDINKRIARFHVNDGIDQTGWDLTQRLRVPLTYNHKYADSIGTQTVVVKEANTKLRYKASDFDVYPKVEEEDADKVDIPFPEEFPDKSPEDIFSEYRSFLNPRAMELYSNEPVSDWSRALWELNLILFEANIPREEVFIVLKTAACNKYARDNKPDKFLWKEVVRGWSHVQKRNESPVPVESSTSTEAPLLTDEERSQAKEAKDFVNQYMDWARSLGDAAWQYHQAGAFVLLSSLLAGPVRLPTSFGTILPNLWFMILADTTLTRKSTAMDIPMDLLLEVDPDVVLATDGSIEGLLTSLSMRPGRPSIFLRDEFTGLVEQLSKRDYYAGMLETLTKLYDGRPQKRVLRRETIEVRDPILILFAGGIKEKMLGLLQHEHVTSGFIPRFVFIAAESDITRLKPLGPPSHDTSDARDGIVDRLVEMREHYWRPLQENRKRKDKVHVSTGWNAELTPDAWARYNKAETDMLQAGLRSPIKELLTPTFDRLSKTGLKLAVLLAASRTLGEKVLVEESDIVRGLYFIEQWREFTLQIIAGIGSTKVERTLSKIYNVIENKPGVLRSTIMQWYHLTARDADMVLGTLEQRGLITRKRTGRTEKLFAANRG